MEKYNYLEAVTDDVRAYIEETELNVTSDNRDEVEQELNDTLFINDFVTGNASGSYFYNAHAAEECLLHNLDLLGEAVEEFGGGVDVLKSGAGACDVTIRCFLLSQAITLVLDEICNE